MGKPFAAAFELLDPSGTPIERGTTSVALHLAPNGRSWALDLSGASPFRIDLADLDRIRIDDEQALHLHLVDRELLLSRLGPRGDELLGELRASWRDLVADRPLLDEGTGGERFPVAFERGAFRGEGELRVFLTRLAILPDDGGPPFVQGFGDLRDVRFDSQRFGIDLHLADGGTLKLGRLGQQTEPVQRLLEERLTALRQRTAAALGAVLPQLSSVALRRVLAVLPDGVPATAACIEDAARGAFARLLRAAAGTDALAASFRHLAELAGDDAVIGLKETHTGLDTPHELAGEEEGIELDANEEPDEVWDEELEPGLAALRGRVVFCVFPVPARNALVVEIGPRSRSATFVFRLTAPPEIAGPGPNEARALGRSRAMDLGRLLVSLGFRWKPLFRDEAGLLADGWKLALRRLPGLRDARARLVGRVAHGPSWRTALEEALDRAAG